MGLKKILIVEDDPDASSSLRSFLTRRGFLVSATAGGADALRIIPVLLPDLVILDLTLPDLSGVDVLNRLRQQGNNVRVIVMTGKILSCDDAGVINRLGVLTCLQKPVVFEEFEGLLKTISGSGAFGPEGIKCLVGTGEGAQEQLAHGMANLLNIIRIRCETFLLNERDGVYREKSEAERLQMAKAVLEETIQKVDEAAGFLGKQ